MKADNDWQSLDNAEVYERFASTYPMYKTLSRALLNFTSCENIESAADLGCGTGVSTVLLKKAVYQASVVDGYDSSQPMLRKARQKRRIKNLSYRNVAAIFGRRYDLIISNAAIWQIESSIISACFEDVLNEGGRLVYNIPREIAQSQLIHLVDMEVFKKRVSRLVRSIRTEIFEYSGSIDEAAAFLRIPIFSKNVPARKLSGFSHFVSEWVFIEVTKA